MDGDSERLRLLGRCLSINDSSGAIEALRQHLAAVSGPEWQFVVGLANRQKITPALWRALRRKGCSHALPDDLQRYLAEIYQRNARRNAMLRRQACEAIADLNTDGIRPIILKGGVHLFELRLCSSSRMMGDLDLLVPGSQFDRAVEALRRSGYSIVNARSDRPEYSSTLFRSGALTTIDLHRDLGPQTMLLSTDEAFSAAVPLLVDGINLLSLSATHRMLYAISNIAVSDPHFHMATVSLCRLYELLLLSEGKTSAIDWDLISHRFARAGLKLAPPALLCLTSELFDMPRVPSSQSNGRMWLYVKRYFLQAQYRPLMSAGMLWGRLVHTFGRARIGYIYARDHRPWGLIISRLRHATLFFRRRDVDVLRTIAKDARGR